ncbi:Outer membrane receptor proteins, mostly Fe transport [Rhizorhabdus histidinilytica]|uniref:Outer membrane receptor proteins, mostly Fe transport n=2 Tax=Rhizorhabdus histidinilytica TaxID=439228 RepID=A0A1T5F4G0_9SPHN|nr:Outer membrane receptor proteins, mostly Fe transport [Rhizorhabdus histidinilytica]
MRTRMTKLSGAVALIMAGTAMTPVLAQGATDSDANYRDEIIVTAQKREENMQKVPIPMQALGTAKLEQYNVSNFNDYTKLLPSLSFQSGQPGNAKVYFRGVTSGGDGNHSGSLPSVGIYLDEQPITTIDGALDIHIYDIARIEALSGPQGTLYGASSQAGTIRIITNKPDPSGFAAGFDADINKVSHGAVGGKLEGFVNQPLSDWAALRVVGWYQRDAGFIDNVPATRTFGTGVTINNAADVKKNYNRSTVVGGRAALGIELDDNWTVTPTIFYQDQVNNGFFGYDPSVGDLQVQHFGRERFHDRYWQAALTVQGKIADFDITYAGAYLDRHIDAVSDYTDYAVTYDNLYAGGFSGYFTDNAGNYIDPSQHIAGRDHFTKNSQELRISSPSDKRFRVLAGLFYQRQTHDILQDYQIFGLADATSVNGRPGTIWLTKQFRVDKDYAAFGEASFDIIPDQLTLTGGLRAFKYNNSLVGFFGFGDGYSSRTGVAACFKDANGNYLGTLLPGAPCNNLGVVSGNDVVPKRVKGNGTTHRLNLTWKPTDDLMVYATWSRGFRPGGINRRGTIPPYRPDYLTNYELGWKTTWLDGKLRINGALFWEEWKKFQFSFLGANSFTEIHNGPNARSKGIELDFTFRPIEGLTLIGSGAYTDAKTRQNLCGIDDPTYSCTGAGNFISAPKGTRLPITSKWRYGGTARYDFDMGGNYQPYVQGTMTYASSASSDIRTLIFDPNGNPVNPAALTGKLRSYAIFDFSAGAKFGRWTWEAYIENAFDKRAQKTRLVTCGQCFDRPYVFPNTPQTIGMRIGWKY